MCGIFAYSGHSNAPEILIEGLKNLEYRGYDSAGIAFFDKDHIHRFRVCGGVSELEKRIKTSDYKSSLGIGHTRWATHGAPSEKNAHPHQSSSIYVVHNGVIENEGEIKTIIDSNLLLSDTDTEVIPHLISYFFKTKKFSFFDSIFKTIHLLKGSYAVVAICEEKPDEIFAFKSGPPLLLCRKGKEFFISSDPNGIGAETSEIIFLEDGEMLHLKKDQFEIFNFAGKKIHKEFETHSYDIVANQKGKHPHFMLKEILEQSQIIQKLINNNINQSEKKIDLKLSKGSEKDFNLLFKNSSDILILACGSSYHVALFAKYLLEDIAQIKVQVEVASEFIYRKCFISPSTPVVFISQSGETADILTALKQTQIKGLKSISLCNIKGSSLDRKSDFVLSMEAGSEVAVASTKTFSASLICMSLLAFHLAKLKETLDIQKEKEMIKHLLLLPSCIEKVLKCDDFFLQIMEKLKKFQAFFYLGRGFYYPIALEGALKLKEIAYLHAEAYPSGEMKHGPLAMIDKNTAIMALLPYSGILYNKSLINLKEAKSRGAYIIGIGGRQEEELIQLCDDHLPIPQSHEFFHPLLSLIPLQMMSYYISRSYGYNVDRPRNLAKSVTVE